MVNITHFYSIHLFFQQELLGIYSVPCAVPTASGKPAAWSLLTSSVLLADIE